MTIKINFVSCPIAIALLFGSLSINTIASANPVNETFMDDDRCDQVGNKTLKEELGGPNDLIFPLPPTPFPSDEKITWRSVETKQTTCNIPQDTNPDPNKGIGDWRVSITNQTNRHWTDLFFVADSIYSVGNADGTVTTCFPDCDAFKIDRDGINPDLMENGVKGIQETKLDNIFSPGETWDFLVTNFFIFPTGIPAPQPSFNSLEVNSIFLGGGSTASITAKPIDFEYLLDPFLSWSLTHFDASTAELVIGGRNATFVAGEPTELPIINSVIDANGDFIDDPLLGALLDYSGIFLEGGNNDGTFSFTDGSLAALNPSNPSDILFSADIFDILADPTISMFSAKFRNFVPGSISPASSPLLAEFISAGLGEIWLDPAIMEVTELNGNPFSQTGTTSTAYLQDGQPIITPEPTSTLSLIAFSIVGAISTLKRKQKPSKSTEKELEKIS